MSENLSGILDAKMIRREIERFPDREVYIRVLEDIKDHDVAVIQSTYPDDNAVEFLLLARLAKDLGARRVIGVVPYFGYARQDRVFKEGESFSARTMADHLEMDLDHIVCVNLHKEATLGEFRNLKSSSNVSVMRVIGRFLKSAKVDHVLSPDKGAVNYARETAEVLGADFDHLEKTRIDGDTVEVAPKELDVAEKKVCIVDDMIATGGTIYRAQEALRKQGAKEVYACCAHGLFTNDGIGRLEPVLDGLFSSDTLENPTSAFSAAGPIAEKLEEILK